MFHFTSYFFCLDLTYVSHFDDGMPFLSKMGDTRKTVSFKMFFKFLAIK